MGIQDETQLIAIVDDDESARTAIHGVLKSFGFQVQSFDSAEAFLLSGRAAETSCLITDIQMPGMSGLELQATLAERNIELPVIFITAFGDSRMRSQAMRAGAVDFLGKPFDDDVLVQSVRTALAS
jgi:FixJ family two-component response regulator